MSTSTAAIILAAGSSSRMGAGRHKLLLPLGEHSVLAHVIAATLASQARPIVVVLGHQMSQVRESINAYTADSAITIVENPEYQQGMSTSLRVGIQALISSPRSVNGALIILGDQPLMTAHILDRLITTKQSTGKRIVASFYNGKRGSPTLFDACFFPELLEMTGDEGGRKVLERHQQEMASVEFKDETADYDVDTWEAYQQVVAAWEQEHVESENSKHG